jgi:hypothetical protein
MTHSTEKAVGGHDRRHGRPASWVLVGVVIAVVVIGAAAIIAQMWWLFWLSAGLFVLSVPVGKVIGIMDDTVIGDEYVEDDPPAADRGTVADPGARLE